MGTSSYENALYLEGKLHNLLCSRQEGLLNESLTKVRNEWSNTVVKLAFNCEGLDISELEQEKALLLANRAIFIGGLPRSGTTWFSSILKHHKELCVLPSETLFFQTSFLKYKKHKDKTKLKLEILNDWLQRLADPINYSPYWVLGRSTKENMPYLNFSRLFLSWWNILEKRNFTIFKICYLSLVYSYMCSIYDNKIPEHIKFWVEKTPLNEIYSKELFKLFPTAKFIIINRSLLDRFLSFKISYFAANKQPIPVLEYARILYSFKQSYRLEEENKALILQYESIKSETQNKILSVSEYLKIDSSQSNLDINASLGGNLNSSYQNHLLKMNGEIQINEQEKRTLMYLQNRQENSVLRSFYFSKLNLGHVLKIEYKYKILQLAKFLYFK